jgi:hypothetical protein
LWRDADGIAIPVVGTADHASPIRVFPMLLVADSNGLIWPVEPTTGLRYVDTPLITPTHYAGANCTGTPYVLSSDALPLFVFIVRNPGTEPGYVPVGTLASSTTTASSRDASGSCVNFSRTAPMYPYTPVPSFPGQFFTPPATPEAVN